MPRMLLVTCLATAQSSHALSFLAGKILASGAAANLTLELIPKSLLGNALRRLFTGRARPKSEISNKFFAQLSKNGRRMQTSHEYTLHSKLVGGHRLGSSEPKSRRFLATLTE